MTGSTFFTDFCIVRADLLLVRGLALLLDRVVRLGTRLLVVEVLV